MADIHNDTLQSVRDRMYAFIFPNVPRTDSEIDAFEKAVHYQYDHESTAAKKFRDIPDGTKSFSIGDFSMSFEDGMFTSQITRKNICAAAYGVLLHEGLLYRGVERGP